MCTWTRYVLIAGVVGVLAASLTGDEPAGWLAAGLAVVATLAAERRFPGRFGAASCPVPPDEPADRAPSERTGPGTT